MPDGRLSLPQAARFLGIHAQTLRHYVREGLIRADVNPSPSPQGRRYRFTKRDLIAFREAHRVGPDRVEDPQIQP